MPLRANVETSLAPPSGQGVPASATELNAEWLSACLRHAAVIPESARVADFGSERVGEGRGFAGQLVRLTLDYEPASAAYPRTLIAKFAADHEATRDLLGEFDGYAREVRFYRELAPHIGLPTPRCYFAHYDRAAQVFLLLLEDLAPARNPDFDSGLSVEQAKLVLEHLAAMHARYWNRVDELEWLHLTDDLLRRVRDRYRRSLPSFVTRFEAVYPELVRVAQAMDVLLSGDEFMAGMRTPPLTLAHNDMHPNNLFLPIEAGGRLALIDWQSVAVSRHGITDVARLLALGMSPALRRAHQRELLRHYHARLRELGVQDYPYRALELRFRQEMAAMVLIGVLALESLDFSNPDGERAASAFVSKVEAAVTDARVYRVIAALLLLVGVQRFFRRLLSPLRRLLAGGR
jgi:thiamine kinase-like enzyme